MNQMAKIKPITFDFAGALVPEYGISEEQMERLTPQLEQAREEVIHTDLQLFASGENIPEEKQPFDAFALFKLSQLLETVLNPPFK